ncbi:MAG: hypothetical protein COX90_00170 [Candidatus Nealsonbacteria bacterium CG_4_10_14_0_2_um_filter_38_17]|uniref:Uncharacterized protein n=2 Tax=Candidatus Nealsoniibacteriota TaxID=1817911 RepID=A0A2M7UZH8_9BACT|nr:MAG: hypothetical protein COX36_00500 [Candidatus Nealsonbacteria bacterium CG23_combo_of_CG06-09_8_20_14_all_38_19]PIZ89275.1 MAG: hypothetical protein COX90_00170 [Candidatus Nealsonbacteria bacterium CG_4_10_14_0_2_um_filter_38_17]
MADISLSQSAFAALRSVMGEIGDRPVYSVDLKLGKISKPFEGSTLPCCRIVDVTFTTGWIGSFANPVEVKYRCTVEAPSPLDLWTVQEIKEVEAE